jgi:hypothetical protein
MAVSLTDDNEDARAPCIERKKIEIMLSRIWLPPIEPCRLLVLYKAALLTTCESMAEALIGGGRTILV